VTDDTRHRRHLLSTQTCQQETSRLVVAVWTIILGLYVVRVLHIHADTESYIQYTYSHTVLTHPPIIGTAERVLSISNLLRKHEIGQCKYNRHNIIIIFYRLPLIIIIKVLIKVTLSCIKHLF